MRLRAGTRKLKRVFSDRKIGRAERSAYPLLVDRKGVLWIVGLVQGTRAAAADEREVLSIWFRRME
jgi:tRNA(Ile)-lysidine synthetase-like protein